MKWSEIGAEPTTKAAADQEQPNGDDRMLAAAAHLSTVVGMWIVVPAAIFVLRRKQSPFIAFHALQATVLSVLVMGMSFVLLITLTIASVVVDSVLRSQSQMLVAWAIWTLIALGALVVPWVWSVIAAVKAWGGERYSIPIVGTIATRLLARDGPRPDRQPPDDPGRTPNWSGLP